MRDQTGRKRWVPQAMVNEKVARGWRPIEGYAEYRNLAGNPFVGNSGLLDFSRGPKRGRDLEQYYGRLEQFASEGQAQVRWEDILPPQLEVKSAEDVERALRIYGGYGDDVKIEVERSGGSEWKVTMPGVRHPIPFASDIPGLSALNPQFTDAKEMYIQDPNTSHIEGMGVPVKDREGGSLVPDDLSTPEDTGWLEEMGFGTVAEYEDYLTAQSQRFVVTGMDPDKAREYTRRINTIYSQSPLPVQVQLVQLIQAGMDVDGSLMEQLQALGGGEVYNQLQTQPGLLEIYQEMADAWRPDTIVQKTSDTVKAALDAGLSMERAQELAEHVMWEYESSAINLDSIVRVPPELIERSAPDLPEIDLGGGPRGGRGYSVKRVYEPPDRREVEKMVREYMGRVIGDQPSADVNRLTDLYMKHHRQHFDNPSNGISPWFSVEAEVRELAGYDYIHQNRPDSVAEEEWLTSYQDILRNRTDLSPTMLDDFARNAAAGAWSTETTARGAVAQQAMNTGRQRPGFFRKISDATFNIARNM